MSPVSTPGFVVHRQPYGDTSLIVRWLTLGAGRVTTMAKGARGPKSPLRGQIDLYYLCDLQYLPARRGDMHTLKECVAREAFTGLRTDYRKLAVLDYFAALIAAATEPATPISDDYELFEKAVRYLDTHAPTRTVVTRFEQALLHNAGLSGDALHAHHFDVPKQRDRVLSDLG